MEQAPPASDLGSPSALAQNTVVSAAAGSGGNVPPGCLSMYVAAAAPDGWLVCDGSPVSRTTYATLFGIISTTYGSGDGSTTFNLPDLRGRVPVGLGTHADVSSLANSDGQAAANRRPKHQTTNSLTTSTRTISGAGGVNGVQNGAAALTDSGVVTITGSIGTNNSNDAVDAPSYLVVNYIIKT